MSRIAVIGIVGESVFLPVAKFHTGGETVEALSLRREPGGKGFNQAVAAARYGASVSFLSAVGDDGYGDTAKAFLEKEGISALLVRKSGASAYAAVITDSTGANRVTCYPGPSLGAEDVKLFADSIKSADILLLNNEVPEAVNIAAAEIAAGCGVRIIMNPAPARHTCEPLMSRVYLFTPNEHETGGLDGMSNVLVTLGGRGCLMRMTGETVPATEDKPVDTTGAGDTFNGVLAAMLADGASLRDSVGAAIAASGISVTRKGAVSSIPYRAEIERK